MKLTVQKFNSHGPYTLILPFSKNNNRRGRYLDGQLENTNIFRAEASIFHDNFQIHLVTYNNLRRAEENK